MEKILANGKEADDAKTGTFGKTLVFSYNNNWEDKFCLYILENERNK